MVCPSVNDPQSSISWDKTLQGIGKLYIKNFCIK